MRLTPVTARYPSTGVYRYNCMLSYCADWWSVLAAENPAIRKHWYQLLTKGLCCAVLQCYLAVGDGCCIPLYCPVLSSCKRVLMTSMGCKQQASIVPPIEPVSDTCSRARKLALALHQNQSRVWESRQGRGPHSTLLALCLKDDATATSLYSGLRSQWYDARGL